MSFAASSASASPSFDLAALGWDDVGAASLLSARDDKALAAQLRNEQRRLFRQYAQTRNDENRTRKGR